jgi:hypothetical protein
LAGLDLAKLLGQALGQRDSAGLDADQGNTSLGMPFGNFMGNTADRAAHRFPIHQLSAHLHLLGELAGSP